MDDKTILRDIESSGQRAPAGPDEQRQYYRLLNEGLLRRVPVRRMEGDTGDPLVCEPTELGRQQLEEKTRNGILSTLSGGGKALGLGAKRSKVIRAEVRRCSQR